MRQLNCRMNNQNAVNAGQIRISHVKSRSAQASHFLEERPLANIKSQIKRNKQNEKRRLRNRNVRGAARTAVKNARGAMTSGEETQATVKAAIRVLDKAAGKGVIHPKNAARRKSRLMKAMAKAASAPAVETTEKKPAKKSAAKK